jgi:SAM-dependent methyltransferase
MSSEVGANRLHWNDRTAVHLESAYYDIPTLVTAGPRSIRGPDETEVGDVTGKRLLHLHCHIGTDSLRWAALGAAVVGVDLSDSSIDAARDLARRLQLPASFIRSDVHDLPDVLVDTFDIVYASYGVICWIPDLLDWTTIAARYVVTGGFFYLADGHPIDVAFDPDRYQRRGYFDTGVRQYDDTSSYTDGPAKIGSSLNFRWHHTLGDVVSAVAASGLRIEFLHENPWGARQRDQTMSQDGDERWHLPGDPYPLGFSLKATRDR